MCQVIVMVCVSALEREYPGWDMDSKELSKVKAMAIGFQKLP